MKNEPSENLPGSTFEQPSRGFDGKQISAAFAGGLGIPPEWIYPDCSPEEAQRRFTVARRGGPAEAEGSS
jgi:hypothetical protein